MDWLNNSDHFIPIQMSFSAERLACIYFQEIVYFYGVPISIIQIRVQHSLLALGELFRKS